MELSSRKDNIDELFTPITEDLQKISNNGNSESLLMPRFYEFRLSSDELAIFILLEIST